MSAIVFATSFWLNRSLVLLFGLKVFVKVQTTVLHYTSIEMACFAS